MKQDIADRWVEALESNEFPQARSSLRTEGGYCCLGVLCELYRRDNPETSHWQERARSHWSEQVNFRLHFVTETDSDVGTLPRSVMEWAGMKTPSGAFREEDHSVAGDPSDSWTNSLASLNDAGSGFRDIAMTIRDKAEEL